MDEMVAEIAGATNLDIVTTRKAVGIIVGFLDRAGPQPQVHVLIEKMPGARQLAEEAGGSGRNLLGVFSDLSDAGLGFGDVERLARAFVGAARKRVGDQPVNEVVSAVPGLGQFV